MRGDYLACEVSTCGANVTHNDPSLGLTLAALCTKCAKGHVLVAVTPDDLAALVEYRAHRDAIGELMAEAST